MECLMTNRSHKTILLIVIFNLIGCWAQAQNTPTQSPPAVAQENKDSVDIKKLEDKYWTAKDDEYGVIQNRTFTKLHRYYGSVVYGPLVNDPFAKSRALGLMLGYYMSEDLGIEFSYLTYDSTQNDTVSAYEKQFGGAKPDYNLIKASKTLSVVYSPFYAKMALANKAIMYFDMGFTLGLGLSDYEIQKVVKDGSGNKSQANEMKSSTHLEIGLTQQLFINQNFALRLDIKNTFYQQNTKAYEIGIGAAESTRSSGTRSSNDTTIDIGMTFFTK